MASQQPPTSGSAITAAGGSGSGAEFARAVRNWLHYEKLASELYKQAINARKVRDEYEENILNIFEQNKMAKNTTIQTSHGKYGFAIETQTAQMSMTNIEGLLHLYFKAKGAQGRDESGEIMAFIKQHRRQTQSYRLRKMNDPAAGLPAPPAIN